MYVYNKTHNTMQYNSMYVQKNTIHVLYVSMLLQYDKIVCMYKIIYIYI